MAALDAAGIEVACVTTDQRATREHRFWKRQQTAGRDGARAIAQALTALQDAPDRGVGFPTLHLLKG